MRNDNSATYSMFLVGDSALYGLIELLQVVDVDSPSAKLDESTIMDNNGGRVEL